MPKQRRSARIFGVPVQVPPSAFVGLALISYFAIPAATAAVGAESSLLVWLVALLHGFAVYAAVVVHELGHVLTGRRLGYPSEGLVLNFWGGHATFVGDFRRPAHQFWVAVSGPIATLLTGAVGYGMLQVTQGVWASVAGWLAWSSVLIAGLNLLPGAPLDGGAALSAGVWALTGSRSRGRLAAGVGGLLVAFLWMSSPWLLAALLDRSIDMVDVALSGMVGAYLAVNAMAFIASARIRDVPATTEGAAQVPQAPDFDPTPDPSDSVEIAPVSRHTRRAVDVPMGSSVAQALALANEFQAGAIVVSKGSEPIGIVRNSAIAAVPADRRDSTLVEACARRITADDRMPWQTPMTELDTWLSMPHADEWLVVDAQGRVYGVAVRRDIQPQENPFV